MVLVGPDCLDSQGGTLTGVFAAAAVAGIVASGSDSAVPITASVWRAWAASRPSTTTNQIDLLVRGGVTPLEAGGGQVSPVRGITTRSSTGGAADAACGS